MLPPTAFLRALVSLSLIILHCCGSEAHPRYEQNLIKKLFADYDVESRPVLNLSEPVVVHFGIAYSEIVDLDEKNQALTSNVWVRQRWRDPWLVWNSSKYGDLSSINVSPEKVWRPDIVLYNNVNDEDHGEQYLFQTKVIISNDGTVSWFSPNILKSSCKINVKYFPFDTQTCNITFGSWTYDGLKLDLQFYNEKKTADLSKFSKNGEWELLSAEGVRNVLHYACCPEPYPDLTFSIIAKRRTLFYVNNLIVPCIVLAVLTGTAFVFPPESGERVSLVMTILLGMTVFMIIFTESIPSTSEVIPLIGKYFTAVLIEISLCLAATCVTLNLHYQNPRRAVPNWVRVLFFDVIGKVLCPFAVKYAKPAQIHPQAPETRKISTSDTKTGARVHALELIEQNGILDKEHTNTASRTETFGMGIVKAAGMDKVCRYIENLTDDDARRSEWHLLVRVIDRLFLILFVLTFVISSLAMLVNRS